MYHWHCKDVPAADSQTPLSHCSQMWAMPPWPFKGSAEESRPASGRSWSAVNLCTVSKATLQSCFSWQLQESWAATPHESALHKELVGSITSSLCTVRPTVAIKSHHSGVLVLWHIYRDQVSPRPAVCTTKELFSTSPCKAYKVWALQEVFMCFQPPPPRLPCCFATWPATELTLLGGFDQSCDKTHLPPRKQNLRELQQRTLIQTILTAK